MYRPNNQNLSIKYSFNLTLLHINRMHKEFVEEIYKGKRKSAQFLMGEHNRLFADWFEKKVSLRFFTYFLRFHRCHDTCTDLFICM